MISPHDLAHDLTHFLSSPAWSQDIGVYEYAPPIADVAYWIPGAKLAKASRPVPDDGTTTAMPDLDLMYLGALAASTHDVSFGASADALELICSHTGEANICTPPQPLLTGITYYWRVDADGQTGDMWSFKLRDRMQQIIGPQDDSRKSWTFPRRGSHAAAECMLPGVACSGRLLTSFPLHSITASPATGLTPRRRRPPDWQLSQPYSDHSGKGVLVTFTAPDPADSVVAAVQFALSSLGTPRLDAFLDMCVTSQFEPAPTGRSHSFVHILHDTRAHAYHGGMIRCIASPWSAAAV